MPPSRHRRRVDVDVDNLFPFSLLDDEENDSSSVDGDDYEKMLTTPLMRTGVVVDPTECGQEGSRYLFQALLMLPSALLLRLDDDTVWYLSHGGIDVNHRHSYHTYLDHLRSELQDPGSKMVVVSRGSQHAFDTTPMKWADKAPSTGNSATDALGLRAGRPQQTVQLVRQFMSDLGVTRCLHGHMDQVNFCYFPDVVPASVEPPWRRYDDVGPPAYNGSVMLDPNMCPRDTVCHDIRLPPSVDILVTSTATFSKYSPNHLSRTCYLFFDNADLSVRLLDPSREDGRAFRPLRDEGGFYYTKDFDFWEVVEGVVARGGEFSCQRDAVPDRIDDARLFDTDAIRASMESLQGMMKARLIEAHDVYYQIVDTRVDTETVESDDEDDEDDEDDDDDDDDDDEEEGTDSPRPFGVVVGDLHASLVSFCLILRDAKSELFLRDHNNRDVYTTTMRPNAYAIFLGDVVDRGPYSIEILVLLVRLLEANPQQCHVLNGNHETCSMFTRTTQAGVNTGVNPMSLSEEAMAKLAEDEDMESEWSDEDDAFEFRPVD